MKALRQWRLRRLQEQLVRINARIASYDYIARHTGSHYPDTHARMMEEQALVKHRIAAMETPDQSSGS